MFKVNKNRTPDKNHHTIDTFVEKKAVKTDIECTRTFKPKQPYPKCTRTFKPKQPYPNLDLGERETIKELSTREDIVITNPDKGGAVVIVYKNDYIKEAEPQSNDKDNYHILPQDPTLANNKLVNQAIDRFKKEKLIIEKIADGLKTLALRTPRFYIAPKIHKPGNSDRSVVSSVNCHTANISKYKDYHLQPVVKQIPSYIKGTNDFINKTNAAVYPEVNLDTPRARSASVGKSAGGL